MKIKSFFVILLFTGTLVASAMEYIHNGSFLDVEYQTQLHRHQVQPYWQTSPKAYSAFKLLKDVEADVAKSHLNVKCLKAPQAGYDQLFLDTEFVAVPHSPVKISWRARGNGQIGAYVFEYLIGEDGRNMWLGRAATMKPQPISDNWKSYALDYTPRKGELGAVMLRFSFSPASGDALDIDLTDVSAVGEGIERSGVPATFVIPKLDKPPALAYPGEWQGTLLLTGFKDNYSSLPEGGRSYIRTGYDDTSLYFGFIVHSGEPAVAKFTQRDATIFRDDSMEAIFTDMEDKDYAHFIINCINGVFDRNTRNGHKIAWSPEIRTAGGSDDQKWWAVLMVPRAEIPVLQAEDSPFKLNFLQTDITDKGGHKTLYLSWSHACPKGSNVTADGTALFPKAMLSATLISAGMEVHPSGDLELILQNPGAESTVFCEYGSATLHKGTVKVAVPHGIRRFKLPYAPDNELAVIVVRDSAGREIYRNEEIFQHRLETHLGLRQYLPLNYVELTSDITSLPEYTLAWSLENGRTGLFHIKETASNLRLDISDLPVEKPIKLHITILAPGGASLGKREFTILRPKQEPWFQSTLGLTDQPLPPFTAIRQTQDGLAFLQTALEFGGRALPTAISSQEHPLLGGPVTLLMDGRDIAEARRTVTSVKPNRIEWQAENELSRWTGWAEEDGFTWFTVTLKAAPESTVHDLYLEIPVRPEYAKLLNPHPFFRSGGDMDGRWGYDGKEWTSLDFKQILTLRNEYRGIELTAEDERDCVRKSEAGSHRLFMRDGHAVIRLTFIDKPVKLERERTYCFGIQAFPTKPLNRPADYLATASYIDPRTAAWGGGRQKALVQVTKLKGPADEGTLEWSAFWDFDPQFIHPDYHIRSLFAQTLLSFSNLGINYNSEGGVTLVQAGKTIPSSIAMPRLAKGWHTCTLTWQKQQIVLWIDGIKVAEFTAAIPLVPFDSVAFGRSSDIRHADFHLEALKLSRGALIPEAMGHFNDKTETTLALCHFRDVAASNLLLSGEAHQVKTDRGLLPSTSPEYFTRLDALEYAGFKSSLAYLNRIFQFYGPQPNGYRNQPYTNEEGYKAFGILCDDMKARGMKIYFGYSFGVRVDSREDKLYRDFFSIQPPKLYGSPTVGFWHSCVGCLDYNNFLLYYFNDLMDRYENLGIYTDNLFVCGRLCMNEAHGCGYHDQDDHGTLKLGGNVLKGRAFAKRIYAITKLRSVPREHFMHSSGCNHAIFLSWADKYLCGEQYLENTDKKGWNIDLMQFRAQNDTTRAFGVPANAISSFVPFKHKGMLAVAGLHDVATYGAHHHNYAEDLFGYAPFLQATTRFGTYQADFIPYYDNQGLVITDQSKQHFASAWQKRDRLLVQVSNLNWQDEVVAVTMNLKEMGLQGKATDAITGETLAIRDGTLALPIPSYDSRLILVE